MKTALLFLAGVLFIASSCGNMKKGNDATAAKNDSVAYKVTFTIANPDYPFSKHDSTVTMKFVNDGEFVSWKDGVLPNWVLDDKRTLVGFTMKPINKKSRPGAGNSL